MKSLTHPYSVCEPRLHTLCDLGARSKGFEAVDEGRIRLPIRLVLKIPLEVHAKRLIPERFELNEVIK